MKILTLNCGSSSIKYQIFDLDGSNHNVLAKGGVERIGMKGAILKHERHDAPPKAGGPTRNTAF